MKTNKKSTSSIINAIATLLLAVAVCISIPATTNAATSKKANPTSTKASKSSREVPEAKIAPQIASAKKLTAKLTATQRTKLLALLNKGKSDDLVKISGIGTTRAKAIAAARPFESVENLTLVAGIGDLTLSKIIAHTKAAK